MEPMKLSTRLLVLAGISFFVYVGVAPLYKNRGSALNPKGGTLLPAVGKLAPAGVDLHMIGVEQGRVLPGEDDRPWWGQCQDKGYDKTQCHEKLAGTRPQTAVEVVVGPFEKPAILALVAQDKVRWDLKLENATILNKIILMGGGPLSVTGNSDVPVEVYTQKPSPCDNCYQGDGAKYAYAFDSTLVSVLDRLKQLTGLDPQTVQLKREGHTFFVSSTTPEFSCAAFEKKLHADQCGSLAKGIKDIQNILKRPPNESTAHYQKSLKAAQERFLASDCR
ncbi:MAG: hypothetical protein KDD51_14380 [Bdellovibrionales bacterium]|nr:hypothetical protein [Bdellovibrionales bacterium]